MTIAGAEATFSGNRHAISRERPRLLGTREQLLKLSKERSDAFRRMIDFARQAKDTGYEQLAKIIGLSVAYVLEGNKAEARPLVDLVLKDYVDQPIKTGHMTFAHDLARCAIVYDLCHDLWTPEERERFRKYTHTTIGMNVESEASPFHNGWWGYKHWGYGMAAYALMYDDPGARKILEDMEREYLEDGVPCLKMAGNGGGWGEGYYIHYWSFEWVFFSEVARWVEGVDYYAEAPEFWKQRAIAAMFEAYPKMEPPVDFPANEKYGAVKAVEKSRRFVPMGDGHGKYPKHERDKTLATRRALVNHFRDDPAHQVVHAFNLQTPRPAIAANAFMDFFWNDPTVKAGNLDGFKLSHLSKGPGFVYARSSWKDDATYFFFKCGPRFTAHQHMDNGAFHIFKNEELLGDGGQYDGFSTEHGVNYYMRTIAHTSMLIMDPSEKYPEKTEATPRGMRNGPPGDNDGGQAYFWQSPGRLLGNGGARSVAEWEKNREVLDIGTLLAYQDRGAYLYVAGDYTKSYAATKAKCVTRQIVYLRPGTFVVFDRVESTNPAFKKTMLLQALKVPEKRGAHWVVTHGTGRLFIQSLAPSAAAVELCHGEKLYAYNGHKHPPTFEMDAAAECRMEISPAKPATFDYFLHVFTTADATTETVPVATSTVRGRDVIVTLGDVSVTFQLDKEGGTITRGGKSEVLTTGIVAP